MLMQGTIFNIQKFSVNDGPGIRTVVFFKGCPLRCQWCANPESQSVKVQILHDTKKCIQCKRCASVCPSNAITFTDGSFHIHHAACTSCFQCMEVCPQSALTKEGELQSTEEILRIVKQDEVFYEESGGGLTISGGEILSQPDFAIELLQKAHEAGIHTCCETTGYTDQDTFRKVLNHVDYVLMDMKHWDPVKHKAGTGVDNTQILTNMRIAVEMHKEILPRIPVIPGFNDTPEDAKQFALLFQSMGIAKVQLLPFHQFGENKYSLLDKTYVYKDTPAYHREDLEDYKNIFIQHKIEAFF